jgi:hypothetical protein
MNPNEELACLPVVVVALELLCPGYLLQVGLR